MFENHDDKKYVILNNEQAINMLEEIRENPMYSLVFPAKKMLNSLVDDNLHENGLTDGEIKRLLECEFIQNTLFKHSKSTIYILNLSLGFNDNTNSKALTAWNTILCAKPLHGFSRLETFLHEIGHLYHVALTSDIRVEPDEFREFVSSENIKQDIFLTQYWDRVSRICPYDIIREQFADLFMIACIEDNKFRFDNQEIYTKTHPITRKIILDYFANSK